MDVPGDWVTAAAVALWRADGETEPLSDVHRNRAATVLATVVTAVEHALTGTAIRQRTADADELTATADSRAAKNLPDHDVWRQAAETVRGVPAVPPIDGG